MVVDTSVWLAILFSQPLKERCLQEIKGKTVFIASLSIYECYKKIRARVADHEAMEAISALEVYPHLDLTSQVALSAADLSIQYKLGMADSILLAHAQNLGVPFLTLDNDFASIPGVRVLRS